MQGFERHFVLWALSYLVLYILFLICAFLLVPDQYFFGVIIVPHLIGVVQNLIAFVITIRDLYKREFPKANQKLTWLLLILCTGGIGWIVYIFKYGLKPRPHASPLL